MINHEIFYLEQKDFEGRRILIGLCVCSLLIQTEGALPQPPWVQRCCCGTVAQFQLFTKQNSYFLVGCAFDLHNHPTAMQSSML